MPRPKREIEVRNLNLQIAAPLYDQLKERSEIKGQTMTTTLERILTMFFKSHPNDGLKEDI